jgi:hypothetical protein
MLRHARCVTTCVMQMGLTPGLANPLLYNSGRLPHKKKGLRWAWLAGCICVPLSQTKLLPLLTNRKWSRNRKWSSKNRKWSRAKVDGRGVRGLELRVGWVGGRLNDIWVGTWGRGFRGGASDFCFSFKNTSRETAQGCFRTDPERVSFGAVFRVSGPRDGWIFEKRWILGRVHQDAGQRHGHF